MSEQRPTPETDAVIEVCSDGSNEFHGEWVNADHARKLERERNALREAILGRTVSCENCNEIARKLENKDAQIVALRDALELAGNALFAFNDVGLCKAFIDMKDSALAKLNPLLP